MSFNTPMSSPERTREDVRHLKEWISKQPHLPKIDDDKWLEMVLCHNKHSLEKTKFKLENYYSLRTKYPEILKNRDPTDPDLLRTSEALRLAVSDRLTKDKTRVFYYKYEENAHVLEVGHFMKRTFMALDCMLLNEENREARFATVTDFQNAKYLHVLKLTTGIAKAMEIFNEAYSARISGVHLINLPSFAEIFIEMIKKYFPKKIAERFYTHRTNNDLLELIGEDVLCSDFGGKGPSLQELEDKTQKDLEKHRKWFAEQDEVCSNELLRRRDDRKLEKLQGSFRKLEVD